MTAEDDRRLVDIERRTEELADEVSELRALVRDELERLASVKS